MGAVNYMGRRAPPRATCERCERIRVQVPYLICADCHYRSTMVSIRQKTCLDCPAGISHRQNKAIRCESCARARQKRQQSSWGKQNPDKEKARRRAVHRNRRARKKSAEGVITQKKWRALLTSSGGKCSYCGLPGSTMDHIVPLSRGGVHAISNIAVACLRCNVAKGAKLVSEWVRPTSSVMS